jgi:hypothetical protein
MPDNTIATIRYPETALLQVAAFLQQVHSSMITLLRAAWNRGR